MANSYSVQLTDGYRKFPIDDHGKLRFQYGSVAALTVALPAADTIDLFRLPPGRVRVLLNLSRYSTSAFGAARLLSIGHRAYSTRPPDIAAEVENATAFLNGADVSAAVAAGVMSTTLKYDLYSRTEVTVFATIAGGTMPIGATLQVLMAYLYE